MPSTPTPSSSKKPAAAPDALQLLMADHREVKAMFEQYQKLADAGRPDDERTLLANEICVALTVHTQLEEEILYPASRPVLTKDEDMVDEAYVEHAGAKNLIAQIREGTPERPMYDAKVKVLGEYIDHHVKEEETEYFPKLRKTALDLQALGARIAARKTELMAQMEEPPQTQEAREAAQA